MLILVKIKGFLKFVDFYMKNMGLILWLEIRDLIFNVLCILVNIIVFFDGRIILIRDKDKKGFLVFCFVL